MSTYIETCPCGARLELSGWGVRDFSDPVTTFREQHRHCLPHLQDKAKKQAAAFAKRLATIPKKDLM